MEKIIVCDSISFQYDYSQDEEPIRVFEDLDFSVEKGDFVAILGHNGSGKSTLAKHFNAILLPTGGTVYISGMDTKDEEYLFDIRENVGMVFQNPDNQIVATIVEEDVAFGLENMGVDPPEIRRRVDEALERVGMEEYKEHAPHQLSGGQKQRVAIAGILAMMPRCIVLDEPTAMLDPRGRREVMETLFALNEEFDITVVLITHYMDEAARANRVVVMDDGHFFLEGTPKEVFSQVERLKSVGLDVPQSSELCWELSKEGYSLSSSAITEQDCVDELVALLEKKGVEKHANH